MAVDNPQIHVVILAAGEGRRMRSDKPKVLMPVGGRPMLHHVLVTARLLEPAAIHVVYGHGGESVRQAVGEPRDVHWVEQPEQLGTGHAVEQAMPEIPDEATVLVLYGDIPLVPESALRPLARNGSTALALLAMTLADPAGYGRVLRDREGGVERIVEEKDAGPEERAVREVNTGILAAPAGRLGHWLERVSNDNAQGEYYLTDVIALARSEGFPVRAYRAQDSTLLLGANDRWQLVALERRYQRREAERLCRQGVTVMDPDRLDVRGEVRAGRDVVLDVNVILEGLVSLGSGVRVEANCILRNVEIGDGTRVLANSVIEDSTIGRDCRVGPFARIRPGSVLARSAAVGNFVEVKKSRLGERTKVNHLSYVGDAELGRDVNIGAGTITCNYDGANKHRTVIGDGAFIGSNTSLVAPVTVGDGATIGAGSTVSKDAPSGKLTVSRARQVTVEGWKRPERKEGGRRKAEGGKKEDGGSS